jgi:hypothetical protein
MSNAFLLAQPIFQQADSVKFNILVSQLNPWNRIQDPADIAIKTAALLINSPYKPGTLEITQDETLIINLTAFDCVTLVETSVAFAEIITGSKSVFTQYCEALRGIRYRNGIIDQYPSRLHYFEDWILDNTRKGILMDITKDIGGIPYLKKVSYMSQHFVEYEKLKDEPAFVDAIKAAEDHINQHDFYYIPKDKLDQVQSFIHPGDIIAITTTQEGMDISHTGFAYWKDGELCLLHASSEFKKVMITQKPMKEYLACNKSQTGIMVLRLQNHY